MTLILAILGLGLLIIVHELGHYFVARKLKMRVERFSIGFGPPLLKWKHGETLFQVAPIPFGGFVQITGMNPHEDYDEDDPHVYPNRPTWARFATIFAGPATNYLTAIVMIFCVFAIAGTYSGQAWIGVRGVVEGGASEGTLEAGDRIVAVDGTEVMWDLGEGGVQHNQFKDLVQASQGAPVTLTVKRADDLKDIVVTPKLVPATEDSPEQYMVGLELVPELRRERQGVAQAGLAALEYPWDRTKAIAEGLYLIVTREVEGEVMGPVGITSTIKKQIELGWVRAFEILALLNVYLGLFNLLPLPALDGGRLAFLGYELATRRRPNPRIEAAIHMVGFLAFFVILVLVTFGDIRKLIAS